MNLGEKLILESNRVPWLYFFLCFLFGFAHLQAQERFLGLQISQPLRPISNDPVFRRLS